MKIVVWIKIQLHSSKTKVWIFQNDVKSFLMVGLVFKYWERATFIVPIVLEIIPLKTFVKYHVQFRNSIIWRSHMRILELLLYWFPSILYTSAIQVDVTLYFSISGKHLSLSFFSSPNYQYFLFICPYPH